MQVPDCPLHLDQMSNYADGLHVKLHCVELQRRHEGILPITLVNQLPFVRQQCKNIEGRNNNIYVFPRKISKGEYAAPFQIL